MESSSYPSPVAKIRDRISNALQPAKPHWERVRPYAEPAGRATFRFFTSLKLTVALLAFSVVIVFFGTLDQANWGIRHAQDIYFESVIAMTPIPALVKLLFTQSYDAELAQMKFPLPGGALLGFLLIVNLLCAHFKHFKARWSHLGISMLHGGLVLLLASGFLIGALQEEGQMWIVEGERSNYTINIHENELVLIDTGGEEVDRVTAIGQEALHDGSTVRLPQGDLTVKIHDFMPNSDILRTEQNPNAPGIDADRGLAQRMGLTAVEKRYDTSPDAENITSAVVEVIEDGESLGTWLVSNVIDDRFPAQTLQIDGREYEIALRFERTYYPFWIELEKFTHDRWPGTEIPRNFASDVRLVNPETGEDRPVKIFMNNPLRHAGLTFYQASFGPEENSSMLQVVRNPAAPLPYWAVFIIGLGMTVHFGQNFLRFLSRRQAKERKRIDPIGADSPSGPGVEADVRA